MIMPAFTVASWNLCTTVSIYQYWAIDGGVHGNNTYDDTFSFAEMESHVSPETTV